VRPSEVTITSTAGGERVGCSGGGGGDNGGEDEGSVIRKLGVEVGGKVDEKVRREEEGDARMTE
jgi:hypothetical protein